ncbi:MAG TPA: DUF4384 domain-containing protein, partial [Longimicrobiaceae bacterium]|nr:DUF4384 domain-containing protein [Longimicrobiaceae bacterium]
MKNVILAVLALAALPAAEAAAQPAEGKPLLHQEAAAPAQDRYAPQDRYDQDGYPQDGYARDGYRQGGSYTSVRVWLEDRRTLFGLGDRSRVYVRTGGDAFVAVFHIDTNGDLEILYPYSSYDDGYVDGGRTLGLAAGGASRYLRTRGGYGVGYVFAVASPEPLNLRAVRRLWNVRQAGGWDSYRTVYGDPFYAIDRLVELVVPDYAYGDHSVDVYTYHVGGRYTHPRYACYDGYGDWYHSRNRYYDSCDRVRVLLVARPYYYDSHHYRGSRRRYYERYYYADRRSREPDHRYKERTDVPPARGDDFRASGRRPGTDGAAPPLRELVLEAQQQDPGQDRRRVTPPARQR